MRSFTRQAIGFTPVDTIPDAEGRSVRIGYDRDGLVCVGENFAFTAEQSERFDRAKFEADRKAAEIRAALLADEAEAVFDRPQPGLAHVLPPHSGAVVFGCPACDGAQLPSLRGTEAACGTCGGRRFIPSGPEDMEDCPDCYRVPVATAQEADEEAPF
jgi:hypothetical protein